jgi:hypothetical protein
MSKCILGLKFLLNDGVIFLSQFVRILAVKAVLNCDLRKYGLAGTPLVDPVYKDRIDQYLYL